MVSYGLMAAIPNTGCSVVYGVVGYTLIGFSYSLFAAITWSCIPYLVPSKSTGTALGIGCCFQALGIFVGAYFVGLISVHNKGADGKVKYVWVCVFLGAAALLATMCAVGILILDARRGGVLLSKNPKERRQMLEANN